MFVLGITGGIGSGKSTVSNIFREKGVCVLDADEISHKVTDVNGIALGEIEEVFGKKAIDSSLRMNRKYISDIVFKDNRKLDLLSAIIHKHVFIYMDDIIAKEKLKKTKLVVLDVPIPVKKGFVDHVNQIWAVTCNKEERISRLILRGLSREDAMRRIEVQMSDEEYESLADHVIDNSGSLEDLYSRVDELISKEIMGRGIKL